ncbi:hypothetical protein DBZ36_11025 [Alginatibacterium sediminis]|uniref:Uncharacterized protein n=1 Tax=Alginatibacterium sediminis TaxID=2164068 RepID=A0A420EAS0_9ALTE|nr:hypothetical protein DBZ36_11025 [Alginatibacterium sediminis]
MILKYIYKYFFLIQISMTLYALYIVNKYYGTDIFPLIMFGVLYINYTLIYDAKKKHDKDNEVE